MQPYFLPYIGYWQLMSAVDIFVIYDNIKYTKGSWINRNRYLLNGEPEFITLPLRAASDSAMIQDRTIASSYDPHRQFAKIKQNYSHAPNWHEIEKVVVDILLYNELNLYTYVLNSIIQLRNYLGYNNQILTSSYIDCDHSLKSEDRVIEICKSLGATDYINNSSGQTLYSQQSFAKNNIKLQFLTAQTEFYSQPTDSFIPNLSILDLICMVPRPEIQDKYLHHYQLSEA